MFDFLIVGAGLTGATIARILRDSGAVVRVVEKRDHIAGNCFDERIDGIWVNRYGGHIFHTNSKRVWDFVNRFMDWLPYEHRVKAFYQGRVYSFPPNKMTMQQIGANGNPADTYLKICDMFFAGYSFKQWGRTLEDLQLNVLSRIPIRDSWDDRYFSDRYQGMPAEGYTEMARRMLFGVPVELGCDYLTNRAELDKTAKRVIYTGPVDALYNYQLGKLEYRSLRFETEYHAQTFQGCPAINYTDYTPDYTRVIEWKYFGYREAGIKHSIVTWEYPQAGGDPYYPVNDKTNNNLFARYDALAKRDGIITAGRLGQYKYFDMDQAIGQGIQIARGLCNG